MQIDAVKESKVSLGPLGFHSKSSNCIHILLHLEMFERFGDFETFEGFEMFERFGMFERVYSLNVLEGLGVGRFWDV